MLSVSLVAAQLGVTPSALRHWIRAGKVRAISTPGGHYRLSPEERDRLLTATTGGATA
jgi:excisionase family DNA binding protein